MTQAIEWVAYEGRVLYDPDGNPIGTIEEFYVDSDDDQPAWALVATGPAAAALCFVPLREARISDDSDDLHVSVTGDEVRDAPSAERGGELSPNDERRLYQHYDMPTPETAPGLMTRRPATQRANQTPTIVRASTFRASCGGSSTATVTSRQLTARTVRSWRWLSAPR